MVISNTNAIRQQVVKAIAGGISFAKIGQVKYRIGRYDFHVKVKSGNLTKYPFNINNTVLSADYEVVVCGAADTYYVLPKDIIQMMHKDPQAMHDNRNPGYTIYDVYPVNDEIVYGTGGKSIDVSKFFTLSVQSDGTVA